MTDVLYNEDSFIRLCLPTDLDNNKLTLRNTFTMTFYINHLNSCPPGQRRFQLSKKSLPNLSAANLEIMKIIWRQDETTINEVWEALNARRNKPIKRATVQVQMNRLEKYGWLTHRAEGKTFVFKPMQGEKKTKRNIVKDIRQRIFGGSSKELVRYLLEDTEATTEEMERISQLLEDIKNT